MFQLVEDITVVETRAIQAELLLNLLATNNVNNAKPVAMNHALARKTVVLV